MNEKGIAPMKREIYTEPWISNGAVLGHATIRTFVVGESAKDLNSYSSTNRGWLIFYWMQVLDLGLGSLFGTYIDYWAHKVLHTFDKMDAINPTFERWW